MTAFDPVPWLPVPSNPPEAYQPLKAEPAFDPSRDLQLTKPERSWTLLDLGYTEDDVAKTGCPIAFTTPFRILSEEGAARLEEVVKLLREQTQGGGFERAQSNSRLVYVAGGVYRSKFLRDLCNSVDIAAFLSEVAQIPLVPHSLPSQQIYINYPPTHLDEDVDRWHADSIGFDYVMLATDPASFEGGEFEVFLGTVSEAAEILGVNAAEINLRVNRELPSNRTFQFSFPAAGFAVFQQGFRVVHRGRRLSKPGDRITVVPGYVAQDPYTAEVNDLENISTYPEPAIEAELVRHAAWRSGQKLHRLLDPDRPQDSISQRAALEEALTDALEALRLIDSASKKPL